MKVFQAFNDSARDFCRCTKQQTERVDNKKEKNYS